MIEAEIRARVPAAHAYDAWADPARVAQWFVDEAQGSAAPGATLEWIWHTFGAAQYRVDAADAPHRLVLSSEHPPEVLEITIHRDGGDTVIRVVNSGFLDAPDEIIAGIRSGWALALAVLREYLERAYGRAKRSFLHMKPTTASYPELLAHFTRALDQDTLVLPDGTRHAVRIIAHTDQELSLAFDAHRTVLELKAFATPGERGLERTVAVRGITWDEDAPFERLEQQARALLP